MIKATVGGVDEAVNGRRAYDASRRRAAARERHVRILDAAERLFVERGYLGTTMAAVAEAAGVAVDTVYASVGTKPELLMLLNDRAVTGSSDSLPPEERDVVRTITAEPDPVRKLEIYARSVAAIRPRQVPLHLVVRDAAGADAGIATVWADGMERRARNLRSFAADLDRTGRLRPALDVDTVRDIIWATSSPESWCLLVGDRGWSAERFADWLRDTWVMTLLADPGRDGSGTPA